MRRHCAEPPWLVHTWLLFLSNIKKKELRCPDLNFRGFTGIVLLDAHLRLDSLNQGKRGESLIPGRMGSFSQKEGNLHTVLSTPTAFAVSEGFQRLCRLEQRGLHLSSLCELCSKLVFVGFFFWGGAKFECHCLLLTSELDVVLWQSIWGKLTVIGVVTIFEWGNERSQFMWTLLVGTS